MPIRAIPLWALSVVAAAAPLPLHFEPAGSGFVSRTRLGTLSLVRSEVVWRHGDSEIRMRLAGADPVSPQGRDRLPGTSNYLLGRDPTQWRTGVPHYASVRYRGLYAGVDAIFRGSGHWLEYDFVVRPGADPGRIRLAFAGHRGMHVDRNGGLRLRTAAGELLHHRPAAYQELNGVRTPVAGRFVRKGRNEVGFALGSYDKTRPLIIDPVLSYSTYLGGAADESGGVIAIDAAGNAYVAGSSARGVFPALANNDVFVAKLNPSGSALLFTTLLGGAGEDTGTGIAVDAGGNVYITGSTMSRDFPTTPGAFRTANTGREAFAIKLDPSGRNIVYSTLLGPAQGGGIAVDGSGSAYVCGYTFSTDFPTTPGAFQTASRGGNETFVVKLRPDGSGPVYSTLLGGSGGDEAGSISIDSSGNAHVAGGTRSADLPTTPGAFQRTKGAGTSEDVFITKLNPQGTGLVYSTYLGGRLPEGAFAIALDRSGSAYVTGITMSADFPVTPGAYSGALSGNEDAFAARLSPDGSRLEYSTLLGGLIGTAIAVGAAREAVVAGTTQTGFPVSADAIQASVPAASSVFLVVLSEDGSSLRFATLLGGTEVAHPSGLAIDEAGAIYVAGGAGHNHPVTPGAAQTAPGGTSGFDLFVTKIAAGAVPDLAVVSAASFLPYSAVAPVSIASAFGRNLAAGTETALQVPLPTRLAGAGVRVRDSAGVERDAPLFFASPGQINFLVPEGTAAGVATVTAGSATGLLQIAPVAGGLFSAASSGRGVAAGHAVKVAADGSQTQQPLAQCSGDPPVCVPAPVEWGPETLEIHLVLFGTGIRGRNPAERVRATAYGLEFEVVYAGPQGQYAGLDQVNIRLAGRDTAPRGELPIELIAGGRRTNVVTVSIR